MASRDPENKVVLIGHVNVGKTSLFLRLKDGKFHEDAEQVVMKRKEANFTKSFSNGSQLTLYDTAGMEKYQSTLPTSYLRELSAIVFVYAVDDEESFHGLTMWFEEVPAMRGVIKVLVGNKTDLTPAVDSSTAMQWARNNDVDDSMVFRVSAKTDDQVTEMFQQIADKITPKKTVQRSQPLPSEKKSGDCCKK